MELESLTRWGEVPPPGDDALAEALLDDTAAVSELLAGDILDVAAPADHRVD